MDHNLQELGRVEPLSLSIELNLTPLSTAVMTLPPDALTVQPGQFMELYTPNGSAGIFRVEQTERNYPAANRLSLTHSLATLSDGLLITDEETAQPAAAFLSELLALQSLWQPGEIALPEDALVTRRPGSVSLLEALLFLLETFPGYFLSFDQSVFPWKLNLLPLLESCTAECRLSRNLSSLSIETDRSDLCTRLYVPGLEEPLLADTADRWGLVSRRLSADADLPQEALVALGQQYLEQHKDPLVTISMDALELSRLTGSALDSFHPGGLCRICLPDEHTALLHRIISLTYADVYGAPDKVRVALSNARLDTAGLLEDMAASALQAGRQAERQWKALTGVKELLIAAENTLTLKADRIDLLGYVTMTDFEALNGEVKNLTAGLTTASWIRTQNLDVSIMADIAGMRFDGATMSLKHMNVISGIGALTQSKRYLNIRLADGGTAQLDIVTDVQLNYTTGTVHYLGYDAGGET